MPLSTIRMFVPLSIIVIIINTCHSQEAIIDANDAGTSHTNIVDQERGVSDTIEINIQYCIFFNN